MKKVVYDKPSTYFSTNKSLVVGLCITDFLFNALMCLIPVMQGQAINALMDGKSTSVILQTVGWFLALVLFVQLNRYFKRYWGRLFTSRMALTMRKVSFHNIVQMDMAYFRDHSKGDILNKVMSDVDDLSDGISKMTTESFDTVVLLLGYCITMLIMDWKITLILLVFILGSIISVKAFKKLIYKYSKDYKEYLSHTKDVTLRDIKNEIYYRGYGVSDDFQADFTKSQDILEKKGRLAFIFQGTLEPIYGILTWLGLFFLVWLGGKRVIAGDFQIGDFSAYLTTYLLVAKKASRIGRVYGWYQNMRVSWERCKPFLGFYEDRRADFVLPENVFEKKLDLAQEKAVGIELLNVEEALVARDFSFGFDESFSIPVMNFTIKEGEKIGICGGVHTGKSTFLAGLSGIYGYEGSLKFYGQEVKDTKCPLGYCSADSVVFQDTLEQNITLGRKGDLDKAIKDSGLTADLDGFSESSKRELAHGLVNLSGGQEKRLMVARALFGQPRLLLLDDPFQSIDRARVEEMLRAFKGYEDSIFFLISNQPFVLKEMDKVLYFTENSYAFDTYEELIKRADFAEFLKRGEQ